MPKDNSDTYANAPTDPNDSVDPVDDVAPPCDIDSPTAPAPFSEELRVAMALAREAGAVIMGYYEHGFDVEYKGHGTSDPVTQADKHADRLISAGLAHHFPQDGIRSEEAPPTPDHQQCHRLWCIDPIDGTREFVAHQDQFVVMIGLAIAGRAALGVVYHPIEDTMYWGAAGRAMMLRGNDPTPVPLAVSNVTDPTQATLAVSRSHDSPMVHTVSTHLGITRQMPIGSVGLKIAWMCRGMADVYFAITNRIGEWDACAPEAILHAAGGRMTDICGAPLQYNKIGSTMTHGLVASNGHFHAACIDALAPVAQHKGWSSISR